jgi:hypothetical protein
MDGNNAYNGAKAATLLDSKMFHTQLDLVMRSEIKQDEKAAELNGTNKLS